LTLEQFFTTVRNSGLLGEAQLDEIVREVGGARKPPDPTTLAAALVKRGLLTTWQTEKLLSGVQKGFFLGKHKLLRLVASGGMSSVFEAEHLLLHRRVALKVLPKGLVGESSYLERFYREARAVARLNHPNIIRGFDVGQDGEHHYFVMEFVKGTSLENLVAKSGPLPFDQAIEMIRQAALGLDHAHKAGLVHRDIKPANLLLDHEGTVKLLDLGLVRSLAHDEDGEASLTRVHDESVLGTVDYLSPEQAIDSHDVDIRSDIYSLGCTFYFLLTGAPPFARGTLAERLLAHQTRSPAPLATLRPDIPEALSQVVARMMAKRPEDRFQVPDEVSNVLRALLRKPPDSRSNREEAASPSKPHSRLSAQGGKLRAPARKAVSPEEPIATARNSKATSLPRPSRSTSRPAESPRPPILIANPATIDGRSTPPLSECWERWARVFETLEARRIPHLPLGEASYQLIYENLLLACRTSAVSADQATREKLGQIEDLVAPWLSIQSLRSILAGDMKPSIAGRFHELDRTMRIRSYLAIHGRVFLKVVASVVAATLIWSNLPLSSPVPAVTRVSISLLNDARQAIRKIAYINDLINEKK
jgi:serine/threonine protein kinase